MNEKMEAEEESGKRGGRKRENLEKKFTSA